MTVAPGSSHCRRYNDYRDIRLASEPTETVGRLWHNQKVSCKVAVPTIAEMEDSDGLPAANVPPESKESDAFPS